jgi:oxaloacetate decarboxylase gamma subunit
MKDLLDGLFLMCVGMGTVFVFLCLMILATEIIRVVFGGPAAAPAPAGPGPAAGGEPAADEALRTAVVTAAVTHHRRRR